MSITNTHSSNLESQLKFFSLFKGLLPYLVLTLVVFIPYVKSLTFEFSPLDDVALVENNFENFEDNSNIKKYFSETIFNNGGSSSLFYRPILMLSFHMDYQIGGESPAIYHFSNILYHIIVCCLLLYFLKRLNINEAVAFILTLIFCVHPINVHTVSWIPGRNDSLLAIFILASLINLVSYLDSRKILNLILFHVFFVIALFTKENAVALPILSILTVLLLNKKVNVKDIAINATIWISVIFLWIYIRTNVADIKSPTDSIAFIYLNDTITVIFIYLSKIFIPYKQALLPIIEDSNVLFGIIGTLVVLALIFISKKVSNLKLILFGALWFLIFIALPAMHGVSSTGEHYENRAYIPLIGLILSVSAFKLNKFNINESKKLVYITSAIIILLFSVKTFSRTDVYKDAITFREAAVDDSPSSGRAYSFRGRNYMVKADEAKSQSKKNLLLKKAIKDFEKAAKLAPKYADVYSNLGNCYYDIQDYKKAIKNFTIDIGNKPNSYNSYANRGNCYKEIGEYDKALADYNKSLSLNPNNNFTYTSRGSLYRITKQFDKALEDYNKALSLNDKDANTYTSIGNVYYDKAMLLKSLVNNAANQNARNEALKQIGKFFPELIKNNNISQNDIVKLQLELLNTGVENFKQSLSINKNSSNTYFSRGATYYNLGKYDLALKDVSKAKSMGYSVDENFINHLNQLINQ